MGHGQSHALRLGGDIEPVRRQHFDFEGVSGLSRPRVLEGGDLESEGLRRLEESFLIYELDPDSRRRFQSSDILALRISI